MIMIPYVHDFRGGVRVSREVLHEWQKEAVTRLAENPDSDNYMIRSGNSFVYAYRHDDGITVLEVNDGYVCYDYDN
jgi:hypothetical protein